MARIDPRNFHPRLERSVLPPGVEWRRETSSGDVTYDLYDPGFRRTYNPTYLESLQEWQRRDAMSMSRGDSIITIFGDETDPFLSAFEILREGVVRTIRFEGLRHAYKSREGRRQSFLEAQQRASKFAEQAALVLLGAIASDSSSVIDLQKVVSQLSFRFENAYLAAYILNAYGVGRGEWSIEELTRWPHQELSAELSINRYVEFSAYRHHPDRTLRTLVAAGETQLAYWEALYSSTVRSFFHDSAPEFISLSTPTLLPPERQFETVPELSAIFKAMGKMQAFIGGHVNPQNLVRFDNMARSYEEDFAAVFAEYAAQVPSASQPLRPAPLPYGASAKGAEKLCRDWMIFLGVGDAATTTYSQDGGIDITSEKYVAQVKNYIGSVGAPEIQQLVGAAFASNKSPIFFTSGLYTAAAKLAAESVEMPLLVYDAEAGTLVGANTFGEKIVREGLK